MTQSSSSWHLGHPGHADSSHSLPRASGSPVPHRCVSQERVSRKQKGDLQERADKCARSAPTPACTLPWEMHLGVGVSHCVWGLGSIRCCSQRRLQTALCSPRYKAVGPHGHHGSAQLSKPRAQGLYTQTEVASTKTRYKGVLREEGDHHHVDLLQTKTWFRKDPTWCS